MKTTIEQEAEALDRHIHRERLTIADDYAKEFLDEQRLYYSLEKWCNQAEADMQLDGFEFEVARAIRKRQSEVYEAGDLEKLFGCAPDFTGELSTEEHMAKIRGECEDRLVIADGYAQEFIDDYRYSLKTWCDQAESDMQLDGFGLEVAKAIRKRLSDMSNTVRMATSKENALAGAFIDVSGYTPLEEECCARCGEAASADSLVICVPCAYTADDGGHRSECDWDFRKKRGER